MPLEAGQQAPWAGQLVSTELAIQCANMADGFDWRIKLERRYAERRCAVELKYAHDAADASADAAKAREAVLMRELERVSAWWRSPLIVAGASFLGTMALVAIVAQGVR